MAKIKNKFDISDREMRTMECVPAGKYTAEITNSEGKDNKSGTGSYLKLEFTIIKGEYKGRKFWENLNLVNDSSDTVRIAEDTLATIHKAAGLKQLVSDSDKLHGKPMLVTLKVKKSEGYDDKNTATGFEPLNAGKKDKGEKEEAPWEEEEEKKDKKKKDKKKKK